jgi:hypothetical protein
MAFPTRLGTNIRVHQDRGNERAGGIVAGREGGAIVHWLQTDGAAAGFYTRAIANTGQLEQFETRHFAADRPYSVANEPEFRGTSFTGGLIVAYNDGGQLRSINVSNSTSQFLGGIGTQFLGNVGAAITGIPLIETTNADTAGMFSIGAFVRNAQSAPLAGVATVTQGSTAASSPYEAPELNNGTILSTTDANGVPWNIVEGAAAGRTNLAVVALRGTTAAPVYELHIISGTTFEDIGPGRVIASGAQISAGSFKLSELGASGEFMATWVEGSTIVAQRYDANGTNVGASIRLTRTQPQDVSVVSLNTGGILLLWADTQAQPGDFDILGQQFDRQGVAVDGAFSVNANFGTGSQQTNPHGVQLGSGDVLVAFDDFFDGDRDVLGRRLSFTAPEAVDLTGNVGSGNTLTIPVLADLRDPNGDPISLFGVTQGTNGAVVTTAAGFTYTPRAGFSGSDSFTYTVTDPGGNRDTATVTVNVTAATTNAAPVFTSAATASVAENSAISTVVYTATATDAPGQTVSYTLGGVDAAAFNINSATGAVTLKASPDFETKPSYSFTVIATDNGSPPLSATRAVALTITDVAEGVPPAVTPFFLLVPGGASAAVQGTGTVFGVAGTTQEIVVRDVAGTITFDGSFNTGGDRIVLAGPAANYTATRSGAAVRVSDGDTTIVVPAGVVGADLVFGDGVRSLTVDATAGVIRLGTQVLTASAVAITAPAGPAVATGTTSAAVGVQLLVNPGQSATALGKGTVFGTIGGVETVTVAPGAQLAFDGSFNAGGDTIVLPGARAGWTAARSGATALLTGSAGESVAIPVGLSGATVRFADGDRTLIFDPQAGAIKLGNLALTTAPAAVMDAGPADFATFVL